MRSRVVNDRRPMTHLDGGKCRGEVIQSDEPLFTNVHQAVVSRAPRVIWRAASYVSSNIGLRVREAYHQSRAKRIITR